jgi:hyperosmotically inducible protein
MSSTTPFDSTSHNQPDQNGDALMPIRKSDNRADVELAGRIRREITKDDALWMTAKNLKIVAIEGHVTLWGPVKTTREKSDIEARAAAIAGSTNVDDRLEVWTR